MSKPIQITNAFTVDVEDYYQVSAFEKHIRRDDWDRWESRVEANTHRMLRLLERHNVKATFFVLGWVADRHPRLVREIHACGHEVGSHGYWHRLVYELSPDEFREDLRRSRIALEDAVGAGDSASRGQLLDHFAVAMGLGDPRRRGFFRRFQHISHPSRPLWNPDRRARLHRLPTAAGELWEFPPSVARMARINLPVSGGGYFRLFPQFWTHYCLRCINRHERQPFMFYVHPWEIDPQQPRVPVGSRLSRFRHYVGLTKNEGKLDRLLAGFRFGRLSDVIAARAVAA